MIDKKTIDKAKFKIIRSNLRLQQVKYKKKTKMISLLKLKIRSLKKWPKL
jgi:hypothetical protein